jgi:hypothetical protein
MVTTAEPGAGVEKIVLAPVPEPVELGAEVRGALLDGADWDERFGADLGVGAPLWAVWGPTLEAAGLGHDQFCAVLSAYRREVWFWLLGDRQWEQMADGLAGRLLRRLPA